MCGVAAKWLHCYCLPSYIDGLHPAYHKAKESTVNFLRAAQVSLGTPRGAANSPVSACCSSSSI